MKKILIVNNNMKVGGVQKSLYNLLWEIEGEYDITLCLFRRIGEYADKLPPSVKVVEARGPYRYFGLSQGECRGVDALMRAFWVALTRLFGRARAVRLMNVFEKKMLGHYDCAISFLHNGGATSFYGGTQDYVLGCVDAERRLAFLHCDYRNCGASHPANNRDMARFDRIAACSDGCRRAFLEVLPELEERIVTVRNTHRIGEILNAADDEPVVYGSCECNILMVSRLSHEKGIERAIEAVAFAVSEGHDCRLHIVGDGAKRAELEELAESLGLVGRVIFYGEQNNPYRYMKNADLFLMTSFHEAAPMVIEEARVLGLPVLTTRTTSSAEMVTDAGCGVVCENSGEAVKQALSSILADPDYIPNLKNAMAEHRLDNSEAMSQLERLLSFN